MDKDRLDETSAEEENLADEYSTAEKTVEYSSSIYEDDEDLVMDENDEDLEMDEDSSKENSSTEEQSVDESNTIVSDIMSEMLRDSAEDSSSSEEDSKENMEVNLIEKHGLMFQNIEHEDRSVNIIIVSFGDCGRTELIETVFCDPLSRTITKCTCRVLEYKISLSTDFHICISVVKLPDFFEQKKLTLSDKTVFLLCYDVDNPRSFAKLEERWIPAILEKSMKEMFFLLVGINRTPDTEPEERSFNEEKRKAMIDAKVEELNDKFCAGKVVECSIEDKDSLLNVFQSSLDFVYPRG